MRTFVLDNYADTPTPVTRSEMGEEARKELPTHIRRRLVLLTSASIVALAIAALPVQFDPGTLLPSLSVAHAAGDGGNGEGGNGGEGGGGNGDGGHGGGDDSGSGTGDQDQDQIREQLRDGEGTMSDQALQFRERARFRNGFTAGEGFPDDTPDVDGLTPVTPEEESGLVGRWTETTQ